MKLYLFRHGETRQSKLGISYAGEELTAKILPEGILATEKIGGFLKNVETEANFSSEYLRCQETAAIVEKVSGKKFVTSPLLNEYVEGEFDDLVRRGQDFLAMIKEKNFEDVAVCTHGAVVACLTSLARKRSFDVSALFDYPKTGVIWIVSDESFFEQRFR